LTSARRVALDALVRIEAGAFAHILVPDLLRRTQLAARDRGFVTELVYGTVRMQRALDFQLAKVSRQPIAGLEAEVRAAVRLGAYQLLIGIPSHAAVGETVEVVAPRQRGFVNAVLRALARAGPPWSWPAGGDVADLAVRTSHPDWIVRLLLDEFGPADALATLALASEPAPVTLRVNPLRATSDSVAADLRAAGIDVAPGTLVPGALVLQDAGDVGALGVVEDGRATPQDQASQAVAAALAAEPGERVLDLAAAPGGKTGAMAERMCDEGLVVASDVHPGRVRLVRRNAARLGLGAIAPVVADGRAPGVRGASFDRVLLDAPCSGLGVLRRRPDARWRIQPGDVDALAALQRDMLAAGAAAVRPGGRLVYAVCTLTPAETIGVDEFAARELTEFGALPPPAAPWRAHGRGALLLPPDARTDGMFVLVLERADRTGRGGPGGVSPSGVVRRD
jgi:16S rRNA (cytosine967-C5)-methyltransferase